MPIYESEEQTSNERTLSPLQSTDFGACNVNMSKGNTNLRSQQPCYVYPQDQTNGSLMDARDNVAGNSHEMEVVKDSLPGAAFNTTPIYDAKGSLVGLQTSLDTGNTEEMTEEQHQAMSGYTSIPQEYQYSMQPLMPGGPGPVMAGDYMPYTNYTTTQTPQGFATLTYHPKMHQQAPRQLYPAGMCLQDQQLHHQQQQQPLLPPHKNILLANSPTGGQGGMSQATIIRGLPMQPFDRCPTVCSLFAILCCPITLWCSLPALVYSMCAYTDFRVGETDRYNRKSDLARHLVITACVVGLLLCIAWAVLAFFYYELMLATVNDILRSVNQRIRYGT